MWFSLGFDARRSTKTTPGLCSTACSPPLGLLMPPMQDFASTEKITIHHVAARAGVSIKTVSRVLNQETGVRPTTVQAVQTAVDALGYSPHPSARNLASETLNTLGFAHTTPPPNPMPRGGFFQFTLGLQLGAQAACQRHDFGLQPLPIDIFSPDPARTLVTLARRRRIGGLIVAAPLSNVAGLLDVLDAAKLCVSTVNANELARSSASVCVDSFEGARQITLALCERGHQRVAFVAGAPSRDFDAREAGYRAAMAQAGRPIDPLWIARARYAFEDGLRAAQQLLDLPQRPTAIFAATDDMALGVMHAAYQRGLRIPQDLSLAGFDDTEAARFAWPPLSTVTQPLSQMAEIAAEQVIAMLRPRRINLAPYATHVVMPGALALRASIGPVPS